MERHCADDTMDVESLLRSRPKSCRLAWNCSTNVYSKLKLSKYVKEPVLEANVKTSSPISSPVSTPSRCKNLLDSHSSSLSKEAVAGHFDFECTAEVKLCCPKVTETCNSPSHPRTPSISETGFRPGRTPRVSQPESLVKLETRSSSPSNVQLVTRKSLGISHIPRAPEVQSLLSQAQSQKCYHGSPRQASRASSTSQPDTDSNQQNSAHTDWEELQRLIQTLETPSLLDFTPLRQRFGPKAASQS